MPEYCHANIALAIEQANGFQTIDSMDTIGRRIRARRKQLGLTQVDLALRINIKQPTLSEIESDKTKEMEASTLAGLCRELMLTPDYVIFGAGDAGDEDLALKSSELLFILRALPADKQESLLHMARGLYSPPAPVKVPASDWDAQQHPKH
jgi:transcriptional regulator with XRE-family HTH domain